MIEGTSLRSWLMFFMLMPQWLFADEVLTLTQVLNQVMTNNPLLRVFDFREQYLLGKSAAAQLLPGYSIDIEVDNIAGSGDFSGTRNTELTIALSSVIELGGKPQAREFAAFAQRDLAYAKQQSLALDLMGRTATQFINTLAVQERLKLAIDSEALVSDMLAVVTKRVSAGIAPETEQLRAQVSLVQASLEVAKLTRLADTHRVALAAIMGNQGAHFTILQGDLYQFPDMVDFDDLFVRVQQSPNILIYASESRLRQAELALARVKSQADIKWSLGVRRLQETTDNALVATISVPLLTQGRAQGAIRSAIATRDEISVRREERLLVLYARLYDAYQTCLQGIDSVRIIKTQNIPNLGKILRQTRAAYERGRYSYLELISVQQQLIEAQNKLIDVATATLNAAVIIEQLTAEPLLRRFNSRQHGSAG